MYNVQNALSDYLATSDSTFDKKQVPQKPAKIVQEGSFAKEKFVLDDGLWSSRSLAKNQLTAEDIDRIFKLGKREYDEEMHSFSLTIKLC